MSHKRFRQLDWDDRLKIEAGLKHGLTKTRIAEELGVHRNTIYNEVKRGRYIHLNSDYTTEERYSPEIAQAAYREHLSAKGPGLKIGKDRALAEHIERKIVDEGYSPAAVLGEIRVQGLQFATTICEATLYSYIKKGVFLRLEQKHLRRQGMKKRSYKKIKKIAARPAAGTSISRRPAEVAARESFGDWEMDCVEGKRGTKETLLVLSERKTRKEIIVKMKEHTAASVVAALDNLERRYGEVFPLVFRSITVDNGKEFSDTAGMTRSCLHDGPRTKFYYCHPYSSWERGTNENTNGMIRWFIPKGSDLRLFTDEQIQKIEDWLNNYPREILGFLTANMAAESALPGLAIT